MKQLRSSGNRRTLFARVASIRTVLALTATTVIAAAVPVSPAASQAGQEGKALQAEQAAWRPDSKTLGFVVTSMYHDVDESDPAACPKGLNLSPRQLTTAYQASLKASGAAAPGPAPALGPGGGAACLNPNAVVPDYLRPPMLVVQGRSQAFGIDLDGQDSAVGRKPAPNTCAHDDFKGQSGQSGVDNQFYRVMGCIAGFRNDAMLSQQVYGSEIRNGTWTVLIDVQGVDDLKNDPEVEIGIYASGDPAPFAANTTPLSKRSLSIDPEQRYWAHMRGRIVDGVIVSGTTTVRFRVTSAINMGAQGKARYPAREVYLRDTRVRLKLLPDGNIDGVLAGYQDLESYDKNFIQFQGDPASAGGSQSIMGMSCPSYRAALKDYADGFPDPATGRCTAISTQFHLKAIPAFVIKGGEGSGVVRVAGQ